MGRDWITVSWYDGAGWGLHIGCGSTLRGTVFLTFWGVLSMLRSMIVARVAHRAWVDVD